MSSPTPAIAAKSRNNIISMQMFSLGLSFNIDFFVLMVDLFYGGSCNSVKLAFQHLAPNRTQLINK